MELCRLPWIFHSNISCDISYFILNFDASLIASFFKMFLLWSTSELLPFMILRVFGRGKKCKVPGMHRFLIELFMRNILTCTLKLRKYWQFFKICFSQKLLTRWIEVIHCPEYGGSANKLGCPISYFLANYLDLWWLWNSKVLFSSLSFFKITRFLDCWLDCGHTLLIRTSVIWKTFEGTGMCHTIYFF